MSVSVKTLGANGRFANGLFQASCAISFGLRTNQPILFPEWKYFNAFQNSFIYQIVKEGNMPQHQQYQEISFNYTEIPEINNVDLFGYWQSEKYFQQHEKEIRELFTFKHGIIDKLKEKWGDVSNKVAIHRRLTDYLQYQHYYHIPTMDYYQQAINMLPADQEFIVFSDDINRAKTEFLGDRFIFADGDEVEDLCLMTMCKRGIIGANSSYSWWGEYLGQPEKSIFPKLWFNPEHPENLDTKDLYRNNWITI